MGEDRDSAEKVLEQSKPELEGLLDDLISLARKGGKVSTTLQFFRREAINENIGVVKNAILTMFEGVLRGQMAVAWNSGAYYNQEKLDYMTDFARDLARALRKETLRLYSPDTRSLLNRAEDEFCLWTEFEEMGKLACRIGMEDEDGTET